MFGITTDSFIFTYFNDGERSPDVQALRAASFVFTRERTSLRLLGGIDVDADFVPDTTFAFDARDEAKAAAFMKAHGLQSGQFICVVPRHRWTPTGTKTRQGLPEDVATKVVVRGNYWLPDEAASLFAHAQAVVSIENHSPIIAAAVGTPFLRVHQPEDSIKADMFRDIGLGDWYIPDINKASGADISAALMSIVRDLPAARRKLKIVMGLVAERQAFGMRVIRRTLGLGPR